MALSGEREGCDECQHRVGWDRTCSCHVRAETATVTETETVQKQKRSRARGAVACKRMSTVEQRITVCSKRQQARAVTERHASAAYARLH